MKEDLGSATAYRAVASGEIDVYIDYSGTLWANVLGRKENPGRAAVLAGLTQTLKTRDGVTVLGPLGFENAYVLVMRGDRAKTLRVASLADLAAKAATLKLGSDLEFLSRPEWAAIRDGYGLGFSHQTSYQPTFMYRALEDGEADVISAFSSDGRIAADHLVILADPKGALPPYDAVILLSPKAAKDARLRKALAPLIGAIPVEAMQAANFSVDRDANKLGPAQAARDLARRVGLGAAPR
jgi:osmoprotectant transport system permease protein